MENIREWAYALCTAGLAGGIFLSLTPSCGRKAMKFIMGLIFLILTFSFFKKADLSNIYDKNDIDAYTSVNEIVNIQKNILNEEIERNIKEVINEELKSININAEEINIDLGWSNNSEIEIKEVRIILSQKYKGQENKAEEVLNKLNIKGYIILNE